MIIAHCVDVSGSMSKEQIAFAQQEVLKRFKPKDIVVLFDIRFQIVTDLERKFTDYVYPIGPIGRGGTDPTEAFEFAKKQNAKTIMYTDGWMSEAYLSACDEIVIIQ